MKIMNSFVFTLALVSVSLSGHIATAAEKSVVTDISKGELLWVGKKVTGQHNGTIQLKSGKVELGKNGIKGGAFEIDMSTIVCDDLKDAEYNAKLVGHLKSDDFFSVDKFPVATFKITSVKAIKGAKAGQSNQEVTGDLTIKGITHPITFPAQVTVKDGKTDAKAVIKVDRTKWDIRYGSGKFFEGLGDKMIYDDFELNLNFSGAVKKI